MKTVLRKMWKTGKMVETMKNYQKQVKNYENSEQWCKNVKCLKTGKNWRKEKNYKNSVINCEKRWKTVETNKNCECFIKLKKLYLFRLCLILFITNIVLTNSQSSICVGCFWYISSPKWLPTQINFRNLYHITWKLIYMFFLAWTKSADKENCYPSWLFFI